MTSGIALSYSTLITWIVQQVTIVLSLVNFAVTREKLRCMDCGYKFQSSHVIMTMMYTSPAVSMLLKARHRLLLTRAEGRPCTASLGSPGPEIYAYNMFSAPSPHIHWPSTHSTHLHSNAISQRALAAALAYAVEGVRGAGGGRGGWSCSASSTWSGQTTWWWVQLSAPLSGGHGNRSVWPHAAACIHHRSMVPA